MLLNGTCFMQLKVNKTCPKKSPLSLEVQLNHPLTTACLHKAVRSCNLKRWILIVDPKNCWQSRRLYIYIASRLLATMARDCEYSPEDKVPLIERWNAPSFYGYSIYRLYSNITQAHKIISFLFALN